MYMYMHMHIESTWSAFILESSHFFFLYTVKVYEGYTQGYVKYTQEYAGKIYASTCIQI